MVASVLSIRQKCYNVVIRNEVTIMGLLVSIAVLWLLWKLLKLSLWLLGVVILIALVAFFVKALLIPAVIVIAGLFGLGAYNQW